MPQNKSLAGWGLLVVLGLNLRPILSSISPLLGEIRQATGLSFQSSALLTSLPVVCMGLVALVGVRVEAQLGERRGIGLGLVIILAWRGADPGIGAGDVFQAGAHFQ